MSRVRIGTCSSPADAMFVRSMFAARGIAVVVGAEHHASLLGALGSNFLSLDIWVDEEDGEEAATLLRDLREHDASGDRDADRDAEADRDADAGPGEAADLDDARDPAASSLHVRIERRRRTGVVLLLGCCITFGTAHMFTRAWMRGITLAALQIAGMTRIAGGQRLGGVAIAAAILTDLIGALWRVRAAPTSTLPTARVHGA